MYSVGLMSGTSLDGVDAVLVDIIGTGLDTKVEVIAFNTYEIPESIKEEIKKACLQNESSSALICSLNFKLGYLFSDAVKSICKEANIKTEELEFVATHGQTVYHIPKSIGTYIPSTLQIGEPSIIAFENNVKVVSNFRTMDIAAGGEGAPLVPYSEFILYGGRGEDIALQNIGGIGNVTVIPGKKDMRKIYAFDTGPGNMMIDEACQRLFGVKYDKGGQIASRGKVNKKMLDKLMSHPYISLVPPKSTGREEFGEDYVCLLLEEYSDLPKEDIIATLTAFTAESIIYSYKKHIIPKTNLRKVIIGGGGAHNKTLIEFIKNGLDGIEVLTQEDVGYSSDAKEAIAFAILGNETIHGNPSNIPSATGANTNVILGNITPKPKKI
ncbi:anhydro-N-acetylmuramic acid kinase AnmK [Clostridium nigeriense]|uniref:anhydro-N-acetylmuramic acid kinase AnmK n=1 Tax=Clostridium nigeriense TaxID=1805470 RepID=UPI00082BB9C1|nr:anhydro-N-acetylmuramic acid kinase AnmK [Clostridium nigeriense]